MLAPSRAPSPRTVRDEPSARRRATGSYSIRAPLRTRCGRGSRSPRRTPRLSGPQSELLVEGAQLARRRRAQEDRERDRAIPEVRRREVAPSPFHEAADRPVRICGAASQTRRAAGRRLAVRDTGERPRRVDAVVVGECHEVGPRRERDRHSARGESPSAPRIRSIRSGRPAMMRQGVRPRSGRRGSLARSRRSGPRAHRGNGRARLAPPDRRDDEVERRRAAATRAVG